MASNNEQVDLDSDYAELDRLVRHLGDELAAFRNRALKAEARIKSLESSGSKGVNPEKLEKLERENSMLKSRLDKARGRTRQMLDRVRFLRQQHESPTR